MTIVPKDLQIYSPKNLLLTRCETLVKNINKTYVAPLLNIHRVGLLAGFLRKAKELCGGV